MATNPDTTMDTAMAQFAALDAPEDDQRRDEDEGRDDGPNAAVDEPDDQEDGSDVDGDEPDTTDEQDDEPAAPAIDPPARLSAEKKKAFAALPVEAQQFIAAEMGEQERAIGLKAQEAAEARKAHAAAYEKARAITETYSERLDQYARAFEPQRPDYSLLATDPQAYAQQLAYYEAARAQQEDLKQHADRAANEAKALQAEQLNATLAPMWGEDWTVPEKRSALMGRLNFAADALGYGDLFKEGVADPRDYIALKMVADFGEEFAKEKALADKWRKLQAGKMENVRAAKLNPRVQTPGTAPQKGAAKAQGLTDSMSRLRKSGDVRDAAAAFRNLG